MTITHIRILMYQLTELRTYKRIRQFNINYSYLTWLNKYYRLILIPTNYQNGMMGTELELRDHIAIQLNIIYDIQDNLLDFFVCLDSELNDYLFITFLLSFLVLVNSELFLNSFLCFFFFCYLSRFIKILL